MLLRKAHGGLARRQDVPQLSRPLIGADVREEYVTLARVGFAFAIVARARDLVAEPADDTCWLRLEDALDDLDRLKVTS